MTPKKQTNPYAQGGRLTSQKLGAAGRKARAAAGAAARWGKQSYLLTIESWDSIGEYSEETGGSHFFGLTRASETIVGFAAAKARKEQILNEIRAAGRRGCVILRGPLPYVGGKIFPA